MLEFWSSNCKNSKFGADIPNTHTGVHFWSLTWILGAMSSQLLPVDQHGSGPNILHPKSRLKSRNPEDRRWNYLLKFLCLCWVESTCHCTNCHSHSQTLVWPESILPCVSSASSCASCERINKKFKVFHAMFESRYLLAKFSKSESCRSLKFSESKTSLLENFQVSKCLTWNFLKFHFF